MGAIDADIAESIEIVRQYLEQVGDMPADEVKEGLAAIFAELPRTELAGKLEAGYLLATQAGYAVNG
jgi:hypothetical protein